MGEKRKPYLTMLLRKDGKKKALKVEFFKAALFEDKHNPRSMGWEWYSNRYRVRVGGKWWPQAEPIEGSVKVYFTKTEMKEIIFREIL